MYEELAKKFMIERMEYKKKNAPAVEDFMTKLSMGEAGVVAYLTFISNGVSAGTLSQEFNISTARIASILNKLENKKYIRRVIDKNDKRKVIVYIDDDIKKETISKWEKEVSRLARIFFMMGEKDTLEFIRLKNKMDDTISIIKKEEENV